MNANAQIPAIYPLGVDPRKKPNGLRRFCHALSLRTFGNNLLTSAAKSYLLGMSFVMFLVAFIEGAAWGFFGSTMIPANPYLSGIILGLIVFCFIWFFDRSLTTSDFLEKQHKAVLNGSHGPLTHPPHALKKISGMLAARIAVAIFSLWLAAPYVAKLTFNADIQNKQQEYFLQHIEAGKQQLLQQKQAELQQLQIKIDQVSQQYQAEVAGGKQSLSGRYGRGASAIAIEQQLNALKQQYQQQELEIKAYTQRIEQAVKTRDDQELKALGIRVNQDSPVLREQAFHDVKAQHPVEFSKIEHTVQGLLILFGSILLFLKLLQFNAVKLYFSSNLQSKWNLYCLGSFDEELPVIERREVLLASQDAIPEEFERIMIRLAGQEQQRAVEQAAQKTKAQLLQASEEAEQQRRMNAQQALKAAQQLADQAYHERLARQKASIEKLEQDKRFFTQAIQQALDEIQHLEDNYLQQHGSVIQQLNAEAEQHRDALHDLEKQFTTQQERVEARQQRIEKTRQAIAEIQNSLAQFRTGEQASQVQTLRIIADYEMALLRHQEVLQGQQAELMGFQGNQTFYKENCQLLSQRLAQVEQQLDNLNQPLCHMHKARAEVESRRVQFVLSQGLLESPYLSHSEQELPHLVDKLRQQLAIHVPVA